VIFSRKLLLSSCALSSDAGLVVLGGEHRFFELSKGSSHGIILA